MYSALGDNAVDNRSTGRNMGLLSGLMGNASEVEAEKLQTELAQVLATDERVEKAYQLIRDMFVFTRGRRLRGRLD